MADYEVEPTTMQSYRSHLTGFAAWLAATERPVMLLSVEPETVEAYLRTAKNQHTKMNKCIALKSFARYLVTKQIWYAGTKEQRSSVLEDVQQPKPSPSGMPGYSDDELRGMLRAVDRGPNRLRNKAVIAVELHGFRSKEVRLMLKRNIVMAKANEIQGEFIIDSEARAKKGTGDRLWIERDCAMARVGLRGLEPDGEPASRKVHVGEPQLPDLRRSECRREPKNDARSVAGLQVWSPTPPAVLGNYTITYNTANFMITRKAASVSAVATSKTYGAPDPTLATTNAGFLLGDIGAAKITFSATRVAGESVGAYTFTPSAVDHGTGLLANYAVTYNSATLTIRVTTQSLCLLTMQYVESSAKYQALPPILQAQVHQLTQALCVDLGLITPSLPPAQKASVISASKIGVDALARYGWLTPAQATFLKSGADSL